MHIIRRSSLHCIFEWDGICNTSQHRQTKEVLPLRDPRWVENHKGGQTQAKISAACYVENP
ncbi:hypothetical protein RHMOL_Rhmol11G0022000 [Rhododendron molle]|uniref:Uncharacterized protein n=1 Tax=Rhododendron molle TaxID=49168 RepID=A0ACC0LN33_RHOML|nr:hypothetical protein RHMOL_Rhmol11G0022000 [Rhododendron molle]